MKMDNGKGPCVLKRFDLRKTAEESSIIIDQSLSCLAATVYDSINHLEEHASTSEMVKIVNNLTVW